MNIATSRVGPHWRIPWRRDEPDQILVHCRFDQLTGTFRATLKAQARGEEKYLRAKRQNDHDAAAELVNELVSDDIVESLVEASSNARDQAEPS